MPKHFKSQFDFWGDSYSLYFYHLTSDGSHDLTLGGHLVYFVRYMCVNL